MSKFSHVTQATQIYGRLWYLRIKGPSSSISVPNVKQVALFFHKLLNRSQNFEIGHVTPGTPT